MNVSIVVHRQDDLFDAIAAVSPPGSSSGLLDSGENQCHKDRDNCDHDQEFDQCKAAVWSWSVGVSHETALLRTGSQQRRNAASLRIRTDTNSADIAFPRVDIRTNGAGLLTSGSTLSGAFPRLVAVDLPETSPVTAAGP